MGQPSGGRDLPKGMARQHPSAHAHDPAARHTRLTVTRHTPASEAPRSAGPTLQCTDLRKTFGERVAVAGLGFEIAPGETYGLLGPNGAGKTTTISMICGLLRRDAGEVLVAGRPIDIGMTTAKGVIGYVPQDVAIFPDLTARENLRFFGSLERLRGRELDHRVDEVLDVMASPIGRGTASRASRAG